MCLGDQDRGKCTQSVTKIFPNRQKHFGICRSKKNNLSSRLTVMKLEFFTHCQDGVHARHDIEAMAPIVIRHWSVVLFDSEKKPAHDLKMKRLCKQQTNTKLTNMDVNRTSYGILNFSTSPKSENIDMHAFRVPVSSKLFSSNVNKCKPKSYGLGIGSLFK